MSVPPPMLAVPPPSMQSVDQIGSTSIVQQSTNIAPIGANIVSQSTATMVTATPVQTIAPHQNQPQIIQQQTILTPGGNMVLPSIQQPVNLNVPPPNQLIPMKTSHIVPPPVPVHLTFIDLHAYILIR